MDLYDCTSRSTAVRGLFRRIVEIQLYPGDRRTAGAEGRSWVGVHQPLAWPMRTLVMLRVGRNEGADTHPFADYDTLSLRYHNPVGPQIRAPPPKCANIALLMPPFFILPWAPSMQHLSHNETF
eukprot:COSAG01_NODE_13010_length_1649_cov_2.555484_1_plen_124_part_00